MWRTRAETAKGVSRGGLFVARRDFGIVTPRRTRTRRGGASTRGRERGAFYRASIAPVREIARRRIPRSIARTSRSIRRGIRSRTRAMRRSTARAVGFRDGRRSKKTKKKQKKASVKRNSLPYRSDACITGPWKYCGSGFPSSRRTLTGVRARGKSPRGVSSQLKAFVRSFVEIKGWCTVASRRTHRDGV